MKTKSAELERASAYARARRRYGDDCHTQIVDGVLMARPRHGLQWHDVERVGPGPDPLPTYRPAAGSDIAQLLDDLGEAEAVAAFDQPRKGHAE